MSEINNKKDFNLNDQDLELVAREFAEAWQRIAKHRQRIEISDEIIEEAARQEELWGERNYPMVASGIDDNPEDDLWFYGYRAEYWRRRNDTRRAQGQIAWDGILLEEVFEALSETDPVKRERELVQVAAVCLSMILSSRREREAHEQS